MLEVRNLTSGYPGKTVFSHLNLSFPAGKITVLLGANGCGKSTLLKTMCGILPVCSGEVLLAGTSILSQQPKQLAQKVAYLAQGAEVPDITVERLVLHGRYPYLRYPGYYSKEDHIIARTAMETMEIMGFADTLLKNLSGGQRQKAYLAMLIAQDTPVVLLDEPTTYLDIFHQLHLMHYAKRMAGQGKTVVMVIHDLPLALRTADRVILLQDGAAVAEGAPDAIFDSHIAEHIFRVRLGRVNTESGWHYYVEEEMV